MKKQQQPIRLFSLLFCVSGIWARSQYTNDTRSQVKYNDLFISYCHLYDNYLYLATYLTCLYPMLHQSTFSSLVSLANNKNSFCAKWVFKSLSNSEFHCRNLVVFRDISWLQVQLSYSNWIVTDFCSFSSFSCSHSIHSIWFTWFGFTESIPDIFVNEWSAHVCVGSLKPVVVVVALMKKKVLLDQFCRAGTT